VPASERRLERLTQHGLFERLALAKPPRLAPDARAIGEDVRAAFDAGAAVERKEQDAFLA
jgi:hypothetical protein